MKKIKVIYWTTACMEPEIEAVSKEVSALCNHFSPSFIFSISQSFVFKISLKKRWIGFHPKLYPVFKFLIPALERWADINHVYGEISPWFFFKNLRRKPRMLTIASEKGPLIPKFILSCQYVIVQTQPMYQRLLDGGVSDSRIRLIPPFVEQEPQLSYERRPPESGQVRILFATAPRTREELVPRGVRLLIDTAKKNPDVHFTLLYRKWASGYTSLDATRNWIAEYGVNNVSLRSETVKNMEQVYACHHFTIIPYTTAQGGKECPNSLIESLGCHTPVLVSNLVPFSGFVEKNACGLLFHPDVDDLSAAIFQGCRQWNHLKDNAGQALANLYDKSAYFRRIAKLYDCCRHASDCSKNH